MVLSAQYGHIQHLHQLTPLLPPWNMPCPFPVPWYQWPLVNVCLGGHQWTEKRADNLYSPIQTYGHCTKFNIPVQWPEKTRFEKIQIVADSVQTANSCGWLSPACLVQASQRMQVHTTARNAHYAQKNPGYLTILVVQPLSSHHFFGHLLACRQ